MAKLVVMPKLGLTMTEGAVSRWLKAEGEAVREGALRGRDRQAHEHHRGHGLGHTFEDTGEGGRDPPLPGRRGRHR